MKIPMSGGSAALHPAGSFAATCTGVEDLGMVEVTWQDVTKSKPMLRLDFFTSEGQRVSRRFTASMYERAGLRLFLEAWRGKRFSDAEASEFDTDDIVGKGALLTIQQKEGRNRTFTDIVAAAPLPKGMEAPDPDTPVTDEALKWE